MTAAAPTTPGAPTDMATTVATTEKKPKGVEVFVRLEETDNKEHRFALRCTLPARWLGRKSLRSLLDTFFDAYERARPAAPHARSDAALWGDASRSRLDLDALLSEDLGHERTLWVRFSSSPEFFGTPKTNTALIEYVPRILTRTTREELRERHEKNVQDRAQRVLDLFAVPREASVVNECRRVLRDEGTSEGACEHISTKKVDIHTIKDCGDDGRYAESSSMAWNRLQGFLPEDLQVGGFVPVRRESKVVTALFGRRWVCRPRFAGDASGDPAVIGRALGLMHRCARTYALHSIACASMELRPRPFSEQLRKDCDFACAKLAASDAAWKSPVSSPRHRADAATATTSARSLISTQVRRRRGIRKIGRRPRPPHFTGFTTAVGPCKLHSILMPPARQDIKNTRRKL